MQIGPKQPAKKRGTLRPFRMMPVSKEVGEMTLGEAWKQLSRKKNVERPKPSAEQPRDATRVAGEDPTLSKLSQRAKVDMKHFKVANKGFYGPNAASDDHPSRYRGDPSWADLDGVTKEARLRREGDSEGAEQVSRRLGNTKKVAAKALRSEEHKQAYVGMTKGGGIVEDLRKSTRGGIR